MRPTDTHSPSTMAVKTERDYEGDYQEALPQSRKRKAADGHKSRHGATAVAIGSERPAAGAQLYALDL